MREGKPSPAGDRGSSGVRPRPKRYRGWYRAAKRGEPWALRHFQMSPLGRMWDRCYGAIFEQVFAEEFHRRKSFLSILPTDAAWEGSVIDLSHLTKK